MPMVPTAVLAVCTALLFGTACVRSPIAPDPLHAPSGLDRTLTTIETIDSGPTVVSLRRSLTRTVHEFSVLAGAFLLTTDAGDTIVGIYAGEALVALPGQDRASLRLTVTGGTGIFNGASGSLTGEAIGAFTGDGDFLLVLSGSVATTAQLVDFHVSVKGASVASCAAEERILVRLQGQGVAGRFGALTTAFSHQVSNSGCRP